MDALWEDVAQRPDLFRWKGPVSKAAICDWVADHGWALPRDLVSFWVRTGGGEVFESEVLLAPLSAANDEDSVDFTERFHAKRGLPDRFVLFHEGGYGLSAVDLADGGYLELDASTYAVRARHGSFDEWYRRGLRAEYAARYGLAP
jgi:hypothetical protein